MTRDVLVGSLFSGSGALDMAVTAVLGGRLAWVCEKATGPATVLAAHHPDVPNLGDITTIEWERVPRVHVLSGGFPCQDVSTAGPRAGIAPGTRSGLWAHMAAGIRALRPNLVVIENVRGLLTAPAAGSGFDCPWCTPALPDGPLLALGAVLADLSELGYDASWAGLRAADVGGAHGRWRVFVLAWPAQDRVVGPEPDTAWSASWNRAVRVWETGQDTVCGHPEPFTGPWPGAGELRGGRVRFTRGTAAARGAAGLLPTPLRDPAAGNGHACTLAGTVRALLPTPRGLDVSASVNASAGVRRHVAAGYGTLPEVLAVELPHPHLVPTPRASDGCGPCAHGTGGSDQTTLFGGVPGPAGAEIVRGEPTLLPTPQAHDSGATPAAHQAAKSRPDTEKTSSLMMVVDYGLLADGGRTPRGTYQLAEDDGARAGFGRFTAAIRRWERVLGRPAPAPRALNPSGQWRLSPRFVEWLMGLPAGHVTDPALGLARRTQLRILGDGVVPQQAAAGLRLLLTGKCLPWAGSSEHIPHPEEIPA